jgi:membrane protein implicated in regulation of membrane protease activity
MVRSHHIADREGAMRHVMVLIAGMVLLVVGAQGAIRLLVDHDDAGLLGWVPGGFGVQLAGFLVAALIGAVLARRGSARVRQADAASSDTRRSEAPGADARQPDAASPGTRPARHPRH